MDFKDVIAELIHDELKKHDEIKLNKSKIYELIEIPPDSKLGDFSLPCFLFAKELKKAPGNVALELKDNFIIINIDETNKYHKYFYAIENFGPYLNFFVNKELFIKDILKKIHENKLLKFPKQDKKIMIEFGQANTHKEFHVGHLRNVCLGDSLVRIYRLLGYYVVSANYPGDIGTHVAKTLWCYLKFHQNDKLPENKGKYLGKIYAEATRLLNDPGNPDYKTEVSEVLQKLENNDPELTKLWKETKKWSMKEMEEIFRELDVKYDVFFFESQVEKEGKKLVNELLKKGIAKEDNGATLIDLSEYKLDIFLLLKSDGTSLYATKDLALAKKKFNEYQIEKSFYVVDVRQSMYFKQLFKTLELMGFKEDVVHVPYDFVTTKNGAMSSREGNIILYEDLRDNVMTLLEKETQKRHSDWSFKKIQENCKKLMIAALKFGMLKFDNTTMIVFDMDEWIKFEGETGPYVEYSYARINSIFKKSELTDEEIKKLIHADISLLKENSEFELTKKLSKFPEIISQSADYFKPSIIARYLIELCQKFNEYYHATQILVEDAELKKSRLYLLHCVKEILKQGLNLLGIEEIEEM